MNIQNEIQKALQHYNAGDYRQAKEVCKRVLKEQPGNAEVLYFMGVVYSHLGDHERTIEYIRRSLALYPNNPDGYHLAAMSYQALGRPDEAIEYFRKTIQYNPDYAEAYNNLANLLKERRQFEDAIRNYQKAVALKPYSAMLHYNLGVIYQEQKDFDNAIRSYRNALQYEPQNKNVHLMLGSVLQQKGQIHGTAESFLEAERIYRELIRANPADYVSHMNLGKVLQDQGKHAEAIACYRRALELNPRFDEAHFSMGDALHETGNFEDSIQHYQKAIQANPDFADAYNNLGVVLSEKNRLDEAMDCFQKMLRLDAHSVRAARAYSNLGNIMSEMGKAEEAEQHYRQALSSDPTLAKVYSNLLLSMNYNPRYQAGTVFPGHLHYARQFAEPLYPLFYSFPNEKQSGPNEKQTGRRLRIGYLSPDFRTHSVAYFIEPVIKAHDRGLFEVFCYSDVEKPDEATERIRSFADQWRDIARLTEERIADLIRADSIDILIDLAGHTAKNRLLLFARKPAPVQASWIGYPATTGLKTIDYKIVDEITDPPGMTEQYYTEKLVRLPGSFLCYLPETDAPGIVNPPALSEGYTTFGSFNNLAKISEEIALIWGELLRELPSARIILKAKGLASRAAGTHMMEMFRRHGVASDRIELLPYIPGQPEHLAVYNKVDIALDTFPYNGATTTCEALWMGVPVITLAGKTHVSRVGASLLSAVGLQDIVANDPTEYKSIAIKLANDLTRLSSLRGQLRGTMAASPLTDAKRFTANLEKAYREMWTEWCNKEQDSRIPGVKGPSHGEIATGSALAMTHGESVIERNENIRDEGFRDDEAISPLPIESLKIDELVKSRHSREGGNPEVRNFLKRMDSRLRTSGMTAMERTFYDVVKIYREKDCDSDRYVFIVCAMFTPGEKYCRYADRLATSCEKYSLPYRIYEVPDVHTSISLKGTEDLAYTKANFIAYNLEKFPAKNILYADVDVLFMDYPGRLAEICNEGYDFAIYNWLSDRHNESYAPLMKDGRGAEFDMRRYTYSHHIGYYCTDQLICSGGVQLYRDTPGVRILLEKWQETISMSPLAADYECLDYAFNHIDPLEVSLRTAWLDKSYLRMPWWPHVKPVILHPGIPRAGNRKPLSELIQKQRFYPEWCEQKKDQLIFPLGYIIDTEKKLLLKIEDSRIVDSRPIEQEFWIYPEEM